MAELAACLLHDRKGRGFDPPLGPILIDSRIIVLLLTIEKIQISLDRVTRLYQTYNIPKCWQVKYF